MAHSQFRNSEKGQGTLEYILLLVIVVGIVVLFGQAKMKPLGQYADTLMGDYLGCLLDKAVLPGDDSCSDILTAANTKYQNASQSALAASGLGGGGVNSSNGKNAATSTQQQVANSRAGGGGGAGANANGAGRRGGRGSRGSSRGSTPGPSADGSATSSNLAEDGSGGGSKSGGKGRIIRINTPSSAPKFIQAQGLAGLSEEERERARQKASSTGGITTKMSVEELALRPKRMKYNPKLRRDLASTEEDQKFGFGMMARLFIIGLILLALILFLASQANQISKSMDK